MTASVMKAPAAERHFMARVRHATMRVLTLLILPVALVLLWQALSMATGSRIVPTPAMAWSAGASGVQDGWLLPSLWHTLRVALVAFVISIGVGVLLGVWLGLSTFWHDVLEGPLLWLFAIPRITLFPLFLLVFGLGTQSQVAFAVIGAHLPVALTLITGIRAIPPIYLRVARAMGLGRWHTFREVVLPASLPSVRLGMRYGFSFAFLSVIVAEMFGSRAGAGYELIRMVALHQVPETFAVAVLLVIVALVANGLFVLGMSRATQAPKGELIGG